MPPVTVAVLLLAPGIVLVRAPWPFVPLLSAAFWAALWPFTPWLPGTRSGMVGGCLLGACVLGLLRLLRFDGSRPRLATVAVAAAALLPVAVLWPVLPEVSGVPVPPGTAMPFHALVAQLLAWRDGVPLTYQPLLAHPRFVRALLGLPGLAADAALLGRDAPVAAIAAFSLAAEGLLLLALFGGLVRRLAVPAAGALAIGLPAAAHIIGALPYWGSGPVTLATAFAVGAGVLLAWASTHGAAVAAALLMAAAAATEPFVVTAAAPWLIAAAWSRRREDGAAPWRLRMRILAAALAVAMLPTLAMPDTRGIVCGGENAGHWLGALAAIGPFAMCLLAVHLATRARHAPSGDTPWKRWQRVALACSVLLVLVSLIRERPHMPSEVLADENERAVLASLRAAGAGRLACHARAGVAYWGPALAGVTTSAALLPVSHEERAGPDRGDSCRARDDRGRLP